MQQQATYAKAKKKWLVYGLLFSSVGIISLALADTTPLGVVDITRQQLSDNLINFIGGTVQKQVEAEAKEVYTEAPSQNQAKQSSSNLTAIVSKKPQGDNSRSMSNNDLMLENIENTAINTNLYNVPQTIRDKDSQSGDPSVDLLSNHANYFCANSSNVEKSFYGCSNTYSSDVQFGDLKASSLLGSNSYNTAQAEQAIYYLRNIIGTNDDTVSTLMQRGLGNLLPDERKILAQSTASQAQASMARQSLLTMYTDRVPDSQTNKSLIDVIETEATRRFTDPTWFDNLSKVSKEAIMRETAQMEAFKLYMDYLKYRQMERVESLLALQLNNLIRMEAEFRKTSSNVPSIPNLN